MFIQYVEENGWSDETNEKRIKVRDGMEFNEPYPVIGTFLLKLSYYGPMPNRCAASINFG